jgi:hypothetical protein
MHEHSVVILQLLVINAAKRELTPSHNIHIQPSLGALLLTLQLNARISQKHPISQ